MNPEEKEFLSGYHLEDYPRPSVTSDIAVFSLRNETPLTYRDEPKKKLSLLLIKRGNPPFKHHWALPGGFLQPNETIETCAERELHEETNAEISLLRHIGTFSEPERDPRGWIISQAFLSILSEQQLQNMLIQGGDDATHVEWFDVKFSHLDNREILTLEQGQTVLSAELQSVKNQYDMQKWNILNNDGLAFDHAKIIASALTNLREEVKHFQLLFQFLPEKFTLSELQQVQQAVLDKQILSANFRRKAAEYVAETGEFTQGAGHRPAKLYRRNK